MATKNLHALLYSPELKDTFNAPDGATYTVYGIEPGSVKVTVRKGNFSKVQRLTHEEWRRVLIPDPHNVRDCSNITPLQQFEVYTQWQEQLSPPPTGSLHIARWALEKIKRLEAMLEQQRNMKRKGATK